MQARLPALLFAALFVSGSATTSRSASAIVLPIEVVGENGVTSSVVVDVARAREIRALSMQIHGLRFADMASVQINQSAWIGLNNDTVTVAEPGKHYGGIGGGFSTLKMTLPLPPDTIVEGANTIRFRFNKSDGVVSGFRVIALNLLTSDAQPILQPDAFTQDDPEAWPVPLRDPESLRAGRELWMTAPLKASSVPNAPQIRARCSDCHAHDGRDLKYFGFSNESIAARSRFHGLSDLQGRQIASYIRSLPVPTAGRPWNPPYQPGPGLDAQPPATWAAGAGLSWVLESDTATLPFIFASADEPARATTAKAFDWNAIVPRITPAAFRPDGNLNPREIPIALQLPDWNHWLPIVHPMDAWGQSFEASEFCDMYAGSGRSKQSLRGVLASADLSELISSGRIVTMFDKWTIARRALLKSYVERKGVSWTPDLTVKAYSTQLWQLAKTWEMTQEFGLETRGRELFGPTGEPRTWVNATLAATAPAAVNIPSGTSGMGGSALTNEYFNASWYELQILLNSGNHRHRERQPVDWIYIIGSFQDLAAETRTPEPARLLVALIKAMQSTDPRIGPEDVEQGWRPSQNVDPTIMVDAAWAPIFEPFSKEARRAITESFLSAWLEKNTQYQTGRYFRVGLPQQNYAAPAKYGNISGSKVWEASPQFLDAGVDPELVKQLRNWGTAYTNTAARFQYSPGTPRATRKTGGT